MSRSNFESAVTVKLLHADFGELVFSAIFERDPHFLHWNRMSLIGNFDDYKRSLPISMAQAEWQLYCNPSWLEHQGSDLECLTFGTAIFNRCGMTGGKYIARDGIQKFADLTIDRHVETLKIPSDKMSAIFTFLQRPPTWYAYPRRQMDTLSMRGEWKCMPELGLKLRLLTEGHKRKDFRVSNEKELIEIPGVEIQSIRDMSAETFVSSAKDLWFSIRVLLMFRFRQIVAPLQEQVTTLDEVTTTWFTIEVEARYEASHYDILGFIERVDDFLVQAATKLANYRNQSDLLHAAAWGYAASFATSVLEAQLTGRVEAIERLVTAYEVAKNLDRSRVCGKDWKPIKSALKRTVDDLDLDTELSAQLKRGFGSPPVLTLQERIERMSNSYVSQWKKADPDLLIGLNDMIKARNSIVHGRLIENFDRLSVEPLRAQRLFEKLFMCFVGCPEFHTSAYLKQAISFFDRRLADHEHE
nr:hypothetical protein [uncultured Cohaesibacter sp.]